MMHFWATPRSLVATDGISVDFFSSGYLDISVPRVRFTALCIHAVILLTEWVSPFGHCRIKACCQLPDTFRRLPRPSSPLTAKASTVYAWSLDHITPSRLRATPIPPQELWDLPNNAFVVASTTHLGLVSNQDACHSFTFFQRTQERPQRRLASKSFVCATHPSTGGASRDRTDDPLLAKQVLSQLSYGPRCS
jgi:hypothetical protein